MPKTSSISNTNRFRKVMRLAYGLGILTNIYIGSILIYVSAGSAILSPIIGTIIFILTIILSSKNLISIKVVYFIAAYTVAIEVTLHTYFLGWNCGFYYFLFLLPLTFLLHTNWKIRTTIIYNGSIILLTFFLWYFLKGKGGSVPISDELADNIDQFNLAMVALVVIITMIYHSHTNKVQETEIMKANIELEQQNKEITEQHDHVQILLKEVHHRVKNNLQVISSLMSMQRRSVSDEQAISILDESRRRVEAIALIHQKLYSDIHGNQVDFKSYLNELINSQQIIQSNVDCQLQSINLLLNLDTAVPLGLIISEMITNSVKHAFKQTANPQLAISLVETNDSLELIFKDNGCGLPNNFDLHSADSLGMEIISALIDQIDAKIDYKNDNGAWFKINFLG